MRRTTIIVSASRSGPTPGAERVDLIDGIRGVALGGILLANLTSFFGADMLDAEVRRAMRAGAAGEAVLFAINWLVEGKFYSIFSMLLGVGFVLQSNRARARGRSAADFGRFFRRRMGVLIGIGLIHMYALWAGDILTLYGVMGLCLPAAAALPKATRIGVIALLFATPILTHAAILASDGRLDPRPPFARAGAAFRTHLDIAGQPALEVFAGGSAADYWAWNTAYAVTRPGTYLQSGRPAKVLALFLVGAWIGRSVLPRLDRLRRPLKIVAIGGALIGLPASYLYASIKAATGSTFLMSSQGLLQTAAYSVGTTPLALAYLAMAALAWQTTRGRSLVAWFVPLGRLALSVYLTQTVIQLAIFSGLGLGLAGRVPIVWLPVVAAIILLLQHRSSTWWLRRHTQGPVEWAWRRLTYGQTA